MTFNVGFDISALDENFKSHAQRGIGRYVRELKRYFDSMPSEQVRVSYFDHRSIQKNSGSRLLNVANRAIDFLPCGRMTARQQMLYPYQLARVGGSGVGGSAANGKSGCDVLHFPAHMDAPAWGLKGYILTVLDLIPLVCADLYKANRSGLRFRFARYLELQAIKNAGLCLCISENTARDVQRILGVPAERIVVTPLGVDRKFFKANLQRDESELRASLGIVPKRPIVLYVGGIDPRKNYPVLLKAFKDLLIGRQQQGKELPVLVLVGRIQNDREFPRLKGLIDELGLSESVCMPGFVEDSLLLELYSISAVFFFPSLYEGFGLPPLEAMAAGVPVVSSNSSSMPEVLGDAALTFDPQDSRAGAAMLLEVLSAPVLADKLRAKGREQARRFTWEATGALTLKAYEDYLRRQQAGRSASTP